MTRVNDQLADALHEIADLLEIQGAEQYRILAYRRAGAVFSSFKNDISQASDKELLSLRGVGKAIVEQVRQFERTGTIQRLEDLKAEIPQGVRVLTRLPGLGPKRAFIVHEELGVETIEELKKAAEEDRIRSIKGFGPKAQENILRAISEYTPGERRVLLGKALVVAEEIVEQLRRFPQIRGCSYAGSVRRMRETIGDIDILVATDAARDATELFSELDVVRRVVASGETKTTVITHDGIQVDLRIVAPQAYGAALQYFTGSKRHNVAVRERAVVLGFKLSEYGLFEVATGKRVVGETEEEVYQALGMQWILPTLREDTGEVQAAIQGVLPEVVEVSDMRGDLQSHSTYSDGQASLFEMASAAAERGYEYYAITDHGRRLYLKSLSLEDIERQRAEVHEVNKKLGSRITVLHGVELNIGAEGELDYPDDVLRGFDVVVASIHHHMQLDREKMTRRILAAIRHPSVHIIGHPTGRRLGHRGEFDMDFPEVFKAAARHKVALEINAYPERLDLKDDHIRWARQYHTPLVISTDAHAPKHLDFMRYGVLTAQRAWTTPQEVINTWPLERLKRFFEKR